MSDNGDNLDCKKYERLRFDKETRIRLSEKLHRAIAEQGRFQRPDDIEFETNVLIGCMEGFAEFIPAIKKLQPEKQQRRQERINSLASHIEGIIEQLRGIDSVALCYSVYCGLDEIAKKDNFPNPIKYDWDFMVEVGSWKNKESIEDLATFAFGLRKAARELPKHSLNTSGKDCPWYEQGAELGTAMALERAFFKLKIKFIASNSSLAAECLRAIYILGGLNIDRVDYWLKQARDHYDSEMNFIYRLRKRNEE
jgi:hypothetical protein